VKMPSAMFVFAAILGSYFLVTGGKCQTDFEGGGGGEHFSVYTISYRGLHPISTGPHQYRVCCCDHQCTMHADAVGHLPHILGNRPLCWQTIHLFMRNKFRDWTASLAV
jgi:hypothetical protein